MRRLSVFPIAIVLGLFMAAAIAVAQTDPFNGVAAGVAAIGDAIDSGEATSITGKLAEDTIVRTAYPGDGTEVSREEAVQGITSLIVSNPSASDAFGTGRYRAVALWIPANAPDEVYLIGSGINASGERITTVYGTNREGTTITSYGRASDTAAVLAQFDSQGDLRTISDDAPGPPDTGTGSTADETTSGHTFAIVGAVLALAGASVLLLRRPSRARPI